MSFLESAPDEFPHLPNQNYLFQVAESLHLPCIARKNNKQRKRLIEMDIVLVGKVDPG